LQQLLPECQRRQVEQPAPLLAAAYRRAPEFEGERMGEAADTTSPETEGTRCICRRNMPSLTSLANASDCSRFVPASPPLPPEPPELPTDTPPPPNRPALTLAAAATRYCCCGPMMLPGRMMRRYAITCIRQHTSADVTSLLRQSEAPSLASSTRDGRVFCVVRQVCGGMEMEASVHS